MSELRNCKHCDRTMRPRRATLKEYPGTIQHEGYGFCTTCRRKNMGDLKFNTINTVPLTKDVLQRMRDTQGSAANYIERRRRNKVPAKGTNLPPRTRATVIGEEPSA